MDKLSELSFRPKFLPSLLFYGTFSLILLLVIQLGRPALLPSLVSTVLVIGIIYLFTFLHAVKVNKEGISALDVWDFRHFVKWNEITSCKLIRLANLHFLRIYYQSGKKSVWLPLFLSNQNNFIMWTQKNLTGDHPVKKYFTGYIK